MNQATLNNQGQITIPQNILEHLNLNAGSKIDFVIDENGNVKIIPLNVPVQRLSGKLHRSGQNSVTLEQMQESIKDKANDWTGH
jgi:hypothetical protein